jgi:hypothetical protein
MWECMYRSTFFLTSALVGREWPASRSGRFTPGRGLQYPLDRRLGRPQSRCGRLGEEIILDPTVTQTPTPSRPACSKPSDTHNLEKLRLFMYISYRWSKRHYGNWNQENAGVTFSSPVRRFLYHLYHCSLRPELTVSALHIEIEQVDSSNKASDLYSYIRATLSNTGHIPIVGVPKYLQTNAWIYPGKGKVKLSLYRPWRPLGLREVEALTFSDIRLKNDGKVVSPTRRPLFTASKIPGRSLDSVVGIATSYGLDDRGVTVQAQVRSRIFSSPNRPDRLWGPPNLLSNGYRGLFPRG